MTRPNLLLVLADQFRAPLLDRVGGDPAPTPVLDGLADQGLRLEQAVSGYPVCSPARAMLLTGCYPWATKVTANVNSRTAAQGVGLSPDARCFSDVLAAEGYRTGYVGKWHLTPPTAADERWGEGRRDDGLVWDAWTPPDQRHGFGFWYSHGACDRHLTPHYWTTDATREEKTTVRQWSAEHETDVAVDFLAEAAAGPDPFALVVSYNPPHQPFDELPPHALDQYPDLPADRLLVRPNVDHDSPTGRQAAEIAPRYFAAATAVDAQIGRLLRALAEHGAAEDTIVVFTSDHGMQLGSHDLLYKNVAYDESMRVPLIVRWPGRIRPGNDPMPLALVDLAPTLLGLMGLPGRLPGAHGRDCAAALLGGDTGRRPEGALYLGPPGGAGEPGARGYRTPAAKLTVEVRGGGDPTLRLTDLVADPYERSDAAPGRPELGRDLLRCLVEELERSGDPWAPLPRLREFVR